jgi:hypothetical protein
MASQAEKIAFLKLWYSADVKYIEDFRAKDPKFSGDDAVGKLNTKPIEGKPKTYPRGYTNQSLNQKAQRYVNMDYTLEDGTTVKHTDKRWRPVLEGLISTDSKGKMMKDSNGLYIGKILKSKNRGGGGKSAAWSAGDFGDWKPAPFSND